MTPTSLFIKIVTFTYILTNILLCVSKAAGLAPLKGIPAHLIATAPFNYIFPAPTNSIQDFASIASNPNSLRSAIRTPFENILPSIIVGPPLHRRITINPLIVERAMASLSQSLVTQLAAILSPEWLTVKDALMGFGATESEALKAYNDFNAAYTEVGPGYTTDSVALLPRTAGALDPNLIVVPFPIDPGVVECKTKLNVGASLSEIISVIRKVYYNQEKLRNFTKHVRDGHIGPGLTTSEYTKTRFNAENIQATMHYIRFILNLILPENVVLDIVQKYPVRPAGAPPPVLNDNVVYIEYKTESFKRDIIIHYQFSYNIGRKRKNPALSGASAIPMSRIRMILANYTENAAGFEVPADWHFKSAYPVTN